MKPVTFHEKAVSEVNEAALYYQERAFGLGFSFLDAIEEAIEQVMANPEACPLVGDEIRHKILKRFPYNLLYVIESDCIRVIAIAHQNNILHQCIFGYLCNHISHVLRFFSFPAGVRTGTPAGKRQAEDRDINTVRFYPRSD
ncbi:ParE toxin of type II toxin-antitoxin system, parDE [Desulfotomaculum arcticum]|uniref:ParE toxin of type II toxin-antitoxin system, parDE n=1 Tax=Desulfotruncus arcticus DSM 17038 TaxID=1121424 RepID=A0A1I2X9C2_9FIRM|nr:ParE toxin of type II toxin-antitoxin system, parDE [Desulfotomaculum arcticum] [Desulfotruncus arcticus DSM 17038]